LRFRRLAKHLDVLREVNIATEVLFNRGDVPVEAIGRELKRPVNAPP